MTIEDKFYNFFTKDVYVAQTLDFLDEEIGIINYLLSKSSLTDTQNMLLCCFFSGIIYKYDEDIDWLRLRLAQHEIHKHSNGLVYGIFYNKGNIYLSFKGSSTINDFLKDANIQLITTKYFPGKVHAGFCEFLLHNKIYREIFKNLKKFITKFNCQNIYVTGHSLGGALSSLFYSLCKRYKYFKDMFFENITFGSPRVGNNKFCKNLHCKRIVYKKDIVTMLPFPICYRHLDLKTHLNPKWGWPSVLDHDINKYYQNLKGILNAE